LTDERAELPTCRLCKKPIEPGAIKCVACGGFQGKWVWLNLGVPTLSLLVALISVVSLSITLLSPLFKVHNSDVRVSFQYFDGGTAHLVASNGGDRPGTIGEAWLDYTGLPKPQRHYLIETTGNRFIPPASSLQLAFAIPCNEGYPSVEYQRSEGFGAHPISETELVVSVVQFSGERKFQKFPIDALPGIAAITDALTVCVEERLRGGASAGAPK
jgi:hypothetical protein